MESLGQSSEQVIRVQSDNLCVDLLPDNGGRVASIRCRHTGTEFLSSGSNYSAKACFTSEAQFEESDCAGMDECLPTVSLSRSEIVGSSAPDHGDLWRHSWRVAGQSAEDALLKTECFSRPLSFARRLSVEAANINLEYQIGNSGEVPVSYLYACHPLFAVEAGDRVILPREVEQVFLNYSREDRVGNVNERISWPLTAKGDREIALDCVGEMSDGTAEMLYTNRLTRGICALYRASRKQALVIHFDSRLLPFLGLWICNGGWPDSSSKQKQYAVALEPTVAPCGSLAAAVAAGMASVLRPGCAFAFSIQMEVLGCDKPWSYDEVKNHINASAR